jgi:CDP-diacylglycerol---glycerol-3-phosphate 3-phosphatidyltransferase
MSSALMLTLSRIVLGPLFLLFYLYHEGMGISLVLLPYVLLGIMCLSELSDLFDGRLARRQNRVTDLGKLLDPMADSIFRLSVLFSFTQGVIQLPIALICVFFYRDTIIGTLRTVCALRGEALAARLSGKIKAVVQAVISFLILILMIPYTMGYLSLEMLQGISFYSVLLGAIYTVCSGVEYVYANRHHLKKVLD